MIIRRSVLVALGTAALAPRTLLAQKSKVWRVGFLAHGHVDFADTDRVYGPFTQGMRELGYSLGKNLSIEWRSAEGQAERLTRLAVDLVRLKVDILVTQGTPAAQAAQKATAAMPIVMVNVGDPVGTGLVKSLARPGGNSTGLSTMNAELGPKLLELLRGMVPTTSRVAVLVNPADAGNVAGLKNLQAAAGQRGERIMSVEASTPGEIANGIAMAVRQNAGALLVLRQSLFQQQQNQIVELAARHRLPSIGGYSEYVEAGGLMSYGQNIREIFRRAATYVDKIFKGANPGDLPVEQPTQFELFVNMKTARSLGIKVPQSILVQATKVIE